MMKAYETIATVQPEGQVQLAGVPFAPGTEVEVTVNAKRHSAAEFAAQWNHVCGRIRAHTRQIGDDEIQKEIEGYRAGA